ncbi:MAG TPA: hypothetical protein VGD14_09615 [bacterium]
MEQFEFKSDEFQAFKARIGKESQAMIDRLIDSMSPVKIGDIVTSKHSVYKVQITRIQPKIIDSYGYFGDRLSFYFWGIPVKKDGITPMKGRLEESISWFEFNGKTYSMPAYRAIGIKPADMRDI